MSETLQAMSAPVLHLGVADWWALFEHFAVLSLLAVGGAITTAPDMHRYLVEQNHWLSDSQFASSIALAQAAPGPNVLFVPLMGWHIGLNAAAGMSTTWGGSPWAGVWTLLLACLGVVVTMLGIMLPSSVLTYSATRWAHRHQSKIGIRAFKAGMAPIVIALLLATGWLLSAAHHQPSRDWPLYALTLLTLLLVWRTRLHMLWLIAAGAALGALGWV